MNPERLLNTFFELVKIDSPCRSEAQVAEYCEAALTRLGFTVKGDGSKSQTGADTDNLIAFLPGTVPGHIALSAHMDCVSPCNGVEPVIRDGVIYSAGDTVLGADDKAGIAAIFEACETAIEKKLPRPDITIVLTVCEELGLVGARALPDDLFTENIPCFVFDANGSPGTIIAGSPYHFTISAEFTGQAAHAGVEPEVGRSAIQMAARAIELMELGRLDDDTTANIGIVEGGIETNIVPEHCSLVGECRSIYEDRAIAQREAMIKACEQAAQVFNGTVETEWRLDYPGLLYTEEDSIVVSLYEAARQAGLEPKMINSGGGADANLLDAKGAEAITLSIGMASFHCTDEYISIEHLNQTAQFAESIIATYANEGKRVSR